VVARNFERARNVHLQTRWAGDPERWGGSSKVSGLSIGGIGNPQTTAYGPQILRAQCSELIAVGWDIVATWTLEGVDTVHDKGVLALEVTVGTGQATSTLWWELASIVIGVPPTTQNAGAVTLGWFPAPPSAATIFPGVAVSAQPIIATALNVRPVLRIGHATAIGAVDHTVTAHVLAHCAPRSWVP